jgi:hypothetical protein
LPNDYPLLTNSVPVQRGGDEYHILLWGHEDLADLPFNMTFPSLQTLYQCRVVKMNITFCCGDMRILQPLPHDYSLLTNSVPMQRGGGEKQVLLWVHEDFADLPFYMAMPSLQTLYLSREVEVNIMFCCGDMRILQTYLSILLLFPYKLFTCAEE